MARWRNAASSASAPDAPAPLVDDQLREGGARAALPVVVRATGVGYDPGQLGLAARRRVAHGVRHLVRDPQREQPGIQPQTEGLGIRAAREMLEADERHPPAPYHQ